MVADPDAEVFAEAGAIYACGLQGVADALQVALLIVVAAGDDEGIIEIAKVVKDRTAAGEAPKNGDAVAAAPTDIAFLPGVLVSPQQHGGRIAVE